MYVVISDHAPEYIDFPPNLSLPGVITILYEMPTNLDLDDCSEIPADLWRS